MEWDDASEFEKCLIPFRFVCSKERHEISEHKGEVMKNIYLILFTVTVTACHTTTAVRTADPVSYLNPIKSELEKTWPENRTINLLFHGHSVPAGYFKTPVVNTLESYPYQLLRKLKAKYPHAVINVINTSIGGENSVSGAKRFKKEGLIHNPDLVFIDYALNDRSLGMEKTRVAWESMIEMALKKEVKVILLTPSPDQRVDLLEEGNELEAHANQIQTLSKKYGVGLVDSYDMFRQRVMAGDSVSTYMSQVNHPNDKGHSLIAEAIMDYFEPVPEQ